MTNTAVAERQEIDLSEPVKPSKVMRLGIAIGGMILGRLAAKAARPAAKKLAVRYGMPERTVVKIFSVTTPLLFTLVIQTYLTARSRRPTE